MKFGKEFASQMVPEWQEAYMDYEFLKNLLKQIQTFKRKNNPQPGPTRTRTLHRAFSGLLNHKVPPDSSETPVIVVHNTNHGSETMFLMAADEGGEYGLVYFKKLDSEFNKAVNFYKDKVDQVMEEAAVLNKQMQAFIAFRAKVEDLGPNPNEPNKTKNNLDEESSKLASEVSASRAALASTTPAITSRSVRMDVIDEGSSTDRGELSSEDMKSGGYGDDGWEMRPINSNNVNIIQESNKKKRTINSNNNKMAPLDVLARVKFNNTIETPRSTIKGFLNIPSQTELKFTRDNLKKAEQQLKEAFVVFYHKLRLLKSYSFLNLMAFSKIMKKYDKIASRSASKSYMKMVDNSYLGSSDEVSKLMERVEVIFIKHFSNSNRSKGMTILRPRKKRERHRVTFSMGFLVGCTISLILALVLVIRARHIISSAGTVLYMETMFPLYSLFGFIVLHMLMYAANIYFWRRFRVNYSFIFGFKEGSQLGYRQILLMSFCLSGLALASVLANLDMEMDPETKDYKAITELLPLGLVVLVVLIVLCPLNILYRSSRFFLLGCLFHCILAPLYKVTLPDFFIADQLTSQVQALRSLEFYICYYGWGDYKRRQNSCRSSDVFKTFSYIVAAIPYGWRFFQCLRRLVDEKDRMQGYNGLKYLSTIIAVCARTAYTLNRGPAWKLVAWIASIIATIVSTYWDIVIDWGLFQRNSKNRWLRDKLLVPHTSVYFAAIILNALLRLAWMQTVIGVRIFSIHRQTMTALVASLEIIRRGLWNFFRLENEHLNNVGKYRAFKSVPLPFNYDEDGHKED